MSDTKISGKHLFITGGAGFIGGAIARELVAENDVTVLDDLSTGHHDRVPDGVEFVHGDVRDQRKVKNAMRAADIVFHQAGLVGVEQSLRAPALSNHVNTGATVELLDYARRFDTRVVLASSAAVYGQPTSVPISEDQPLEPTSPYGVDKLAADQYARVFAEQYDLPAVVLRYFNVYGPRTGPNPYSAVVDTFVEQARAGEPITIHGDGSQTRDFVHVDDVVQANCLAAQTDAVGRAYNVGSGESLSIRELADVVTSALDSDSEIRYVDGRAGDIQVSQADISRARQALGYEPRRSLASEIQALVSQTTERASALS